MSKLPSTSRSYLPLCFYMYNTPLHNFSVRCIASAVTLSLNPAPVTKLASILPFVFNLIILLHTPLKKQMNLLEQSYHQLVLYFTYKSPHPELCKVGSRLPSAKSRTTLFEVVVLYFVNSYNYNFTIFVRLHTILLVNPEPALSVHHVIHHYLVWLVPSCIYSIERRRNLQP
jgi:hypothetical protein